MLHRKKRPLVSIITITFNNENTVKDTIESLLNQTYDNLEYIIVDGQSLDETVSIINQYEDKIKSRNILFKFLSEKDEGIADAWNKGLKLSTGDIIGMLNSDDWYDNMAVENVVNCLNINNSELSYGVCKRVNEKNEVTEVMDKKFNPKRIYLNFGFSHTTCFATRKTYDLVGGFNLDYKIAIDTDFLFRAFKLGVKFKKCSNVTFMRLGGVSTKFKSVALNENQRAMLNNGFNPIFVFIYGMIKKGILILQEFKLL
ncbi:glycosyltransferase involved in cell wall biosynthesis [Mariniflexile fucanivorans]|uniref:Glycosyltransferase involved in cell wall biosynthesis n=1 Tax=Mariniflexile fucanivorans TaxID=264023 RepID=A0A4R1RS91_9FLAO|nr:glycosyltransferase family 2 protein [Mariniflexile fucanivorans]TCL69234.1 glycosyltransferase involved in cell wall biosynthesis [Mariniflexile fucanivorans]